MNHHVKFPKFAQSTGRWVALFVLCFGAALLGGCGYTQKEIYPEDVGSVYVPIFENKTFYRGVEFDVTEALIKEIETRTPYKVVSSEERADTRLAGTVIQVDQSQLSRRRKGGLPQEMEVTVTVDFEWRNLRTQQIMRERRGFSVVGRYLPAREIGEPLEVAQHEAAQRLATSIVGTMQADW